MAQLKVFANLPENKIWDYRGAEQSAYDEAIIRHFIEHLPGIYFEEEGHSEPPRFTGSMHGGQEIDLSFVHESDFYTEDQMRLLRSSRDESKQRLERDRLAAQAAEDETAAKKLREAEIQELQRLREKYPNEA